MPFLRPIVVCILLLISCEQVRAQGSASVPNAMQGFAQNRGEPVKIEAAVLEVRDKKKEATFSGNVKVTQGDTTMTSKTLVVFYEDKDKTAQPSSPGGAGKGDAGKGKAAMPTQPPTQSGTAQPAAPGPGSSQIKRMEARSNVVVTQKDQVVTGETAIFDTKANLITMLGGVVLTQCQNVVRGDRLLVDMTTGVSRVESDSGRVQALVVQGQSCGTAPAGASPPTPPLNSAKPK
ncbi:LptA/OstA family protein [Bradyrhizobium jicamae]|uniref:LptA/OstA family protein n=1 Tax=Bradyrhizobium jicamae TaxID=280332 RepID=A0ABS5FBT8_9BRAD|nr:LptA/OstA family protein [Bradyrhizobium jicamae]MBR0794169.1 LptA/OstA family protein [Bradyrhizobium jicamae]